MKEIYMSREGINARINEWGSNDNPTIICLHGLGSTSLSFIELGHLLKNQYHLISIDLPGHGKTPEFNKEEDYEMPNMVKWVDQVISYLTDQPFYLLAHSYGADIVLHYMASYKSKVIKTLLLDGGYYIKSEWYKYQESINGKLNSLQKEIDYYIKDFDQYSFSTLDEHLKSEKRNYMRWSELLEEASKDLVKVENGKFVWHAKGLTAKLAIKSMYNNPPDTVYHQLPNTICLLQSTLPESLNEYRNHFTLKFKNITCSKIVRINNASHFIHWDEPYKVVEEINNWFRK